MREQLVKRLGEFLREEEILLERAGLKPEKVQEVMKDIRAVTQPPYPRVPQDLWNKHIKQAIDVACNFPKSSVLLVTHNIFDYVNEVRKKYKWVSVVVVGTVDGLSAVVDPTVIGTAPKICGPTSPMLMGVGHQGRRGRRQHHPTFSGMSAPATLFAGGFDHAQEALQKTRSQGDRYK